MFLTTGNFFDFVENYFAKGAVNIHLVNNTPDEVKGLFYNIHQA